MSCIYKFDPDEVKDGLYIQQKCYEKGFVISLEEVIKTWSWCSYQWGCNFINPKKCEDEFYRQYFEYLQKRIEV